MKLVKIVALALSFSFGSIGFANVAFACGDGKACNCKGHGKEGGKEGACDHKNCKGGPNCQHKDAKDEGKAPPKAEEKK